MLNKYFDKIYLINLDYRKDRLNDSIIECAKWGIEFERFNACDGRTEKFNRPQHYEIGQPEQYWNDNAAAVCMSFARVLQQAKEDKLNNVLIMEDDIEFSPKILYIDEYMKSVPTDYETLFFGSNLRGFEQINQHVIKLNSGYALHCHAVHHSVYDLIIDNLLVLNNPADVVYDKIVFPRGKSYCFKPFLASQRASHSSITGTYADYQFLRDY